MKMKKIIFEESKLYELHTMVRALDNEQDLRAIVGGSGPDEPGGPPPEEYYGFVMLMQMRFGLVTRGSRALRGALLAGQSAGKFVVI